MKHKVARRVLADHARLKRKLDALTAQYSDGDGEAHAGLVAAEAAQDTARVNWTAASVVADDLQRRATALQVEASDARDRAELARIAFDKIVGDTAEIHHEAARKRTAFEQKTAALVTELEKIEKLVPDAEARLRDSEERAKPCETCDGKGVVPAFCADPKHAKDNPAQGAGEPHECRGIQVAACPACSAPVVAKTGITGTKIHPGLLVRRGSRPRHPVLLIRATGLSDEARRAKS